MIDQHHIYQLPFPNGKQYIGVSRNPDERWRSHCFNARRGDNTALYNAMRKYGANNVKRRILVVGFREYIEEMEAAIISSFGTVVPGGYNIRPGGDSSPALIPEAQEKIRQSKLRHWQDPTYRAGIVAVNTGRVMTNEQNLKNSIAKKQHWNDPAYRARLVAAHTGKTASESTRAAMSASGKRVWSDPSRLAKQPKMERDPKTGRLLGKAKEE